MSFKVSSLIAKKYKYLIFFVAPLILSGCLGTKHIKENEKLLFSQRIQAPKHISTDDLKGLYVQQPNRRLLGLPLYYLAAVYYWGEKHYDQDKYIRKKEKVEKKYDYKIAKATSQKKINNYQFRKQKKVDKLTSMIEDGNMRMQWGEKVSTYDSASEERTIERFQEYLFSKGYFTNTVSSKVVYVKKTFFRKLLGKLASVTYKVEPGQAYFLDSVFYSVQDSALLDLIHKNEKNSLLKAGQRYDQDNFTKERERLDLLFKDNGYFDFSRQYIEFKVDTTFKENRKVAVMINILDPSKRGYHKQFIVDSVKFTTDAGLNLTDQQRHHRFYRNTKYLFYKDNYSLKILSQRIFLTPQAPYSRTLTFSTQRQLANLDAFKFVNINYDSAGGKFIANIYTSPLDRYEWSNEVGVSVTQGFPGPFVNVNFKKRNIFGGFENFDLNGRFGFEGVASATSDQNIYKSTEAGVNASITFPQFLWPFKEKTQFKFGRYNPKTRLTIGYNYTDRPEYRRAGTTISNTYTWQNKRTTSFSLSVPNISIINSTVDSLFQLELDRQESLGNFNLVNSFNPSFISSILFGITWNPNEYGNAAKNSTFIRAQVESGGTLLNFINTDFITDRGLQYFQYLRFNFDFRRMIRLNKWGVLAYRFNSGIAYSYTKDKSLPYEKFYFAGGSNSLRAWRPRRLGPGSFKPDIDADPVANGYFNYSFEKPAEVLIEGSIELRKKIVGFIDGAVFVDVGNVWALKELVKESPTEPGVIIPNGNSKFQLNGFFRELAIGTGFGVRFDFSFLILRFDMGIKVYDPAYDEGNRFVLNKMKFFKPFATKTGENTYKSYKEPVIYNIGVGFPF
ncbi:MAG: BamA/TamA family outer membrane protein [Cyclobacteriaceae bacterium]|nr:BamA/TamA family outer membrane protein [Cyclobacteriaceae bacterium]